MRLLKQTEEAIVVIKYELLLNMCLGKSKFGFMYGSLNDVAFDEWICLVMTNHLDLTSPGHIYREQIVIKASCLLESDNQCIIQC